MAGQDLNERVYTCQQRCDVTGRSRTKRNCLRPTSMPVNQPCPCPKADPELIENNQYLMRPPARPILISNRPLDWIYRQYHPRSGLLGIHGVGEFWHTMPPWHQQNIVHAMLELLQLHLFELHSLFSLLQHFISFSSSGGTMRSLLHDICEIYIITPSDNKGMLLEGSLGLNQICHDEINKLHFILGNSKNNFLKAKMKSSIFLSERRQSFIIRTLSNIFITHQGFRNKNVSYVDGFYGLWETSLGGTRKLICCTGGPCRLSNEKGNLGKNHNRDLLDNYMLTDHKLSSIILLMVSNSLLSNIGRSNSSTSRTNGSICCTCYSAFPMQGKLYDCFVIQLYCLPEEERLKFNIPFCDVDVDDKAALNTSQSSSNSSLSAKSLESPSNSLETVHKNTGGSMAAAKMDKITSSLPVGSSSQVHNSVSSPHNIHVQHHVYDDSDLEAETEAPNWQEGIKWEVVKIMKPKEKSRQDVINVLEGVFYRSMLQEQVASSDFIGLLFSNLEEMIEVHRSINSAMKEKKQEDAIVGDIGDLMLKFFDGICGENLKQAAAKFCQNQSIALDMLRYKQRKDKKLARFISVSGTDEHKKVLRAVDCSKKILNFVNQSVKEAENKQRLLELQKKIDRSHFDKVDHPISHEFRVWAFYLFYRS
ncbi:Rho guanine nucleotide exchange factor 11 [Nymphon striatum]|nr:Rho guanine nucleotide exchange factor 11 [Nymphon striatum]